MAEDRGWLWSLAYFPNGVASGIIGTLIPLYLVQVLGASLVDLGLMAFAASALLIPASVLLGSLPDRFHASKPFILVSFLGVSAALFLMAGVTSVLVFQALYVAMALVDYIRGPSTSVLVAETYERKRRGSVLAGQGFSESAGGVIGLAVCVATVDTLGYRALLTLSAPLVFASFLLSLLAIREQPLYIERNMDRVDHVIDEMDEFTYHLRGDGTYSPDPRGAWRLSRGSNMVLFGAARAVFAFAASNALTCISIFLLRGVGLASPLVFAVFLARGIAGTASYLVAGRLTGGDGSRAIKAGTLMRAVTVGLLPAVLFVPFPVNMVAAAALLSVIALGWSVYSVGVGAATVIYAAPGTLGVYDALASIGGALGSYSGGFIPTLLGFEALFVLSAVFFAVALVLFYLSLR